MENKIILCLCTLISISSFSQIGLNTVTPSATLDIVSSGNTSVTKALELNNSSGTEMVTVLDNGNAGIGTSFPSTKLHINSPTSPALRIVDGTQGVGKVLSSDANGNTSWVTNLAVAPTILGTNPSVMEVFNNLSGSSKNLGMRITLPAGKWIVNVGLLINGVDSSTSASSEWAVLRFQFSTNSSTLSTSGYTTLQSGSFGYFYKEFYLGQFNPSKAFMTGSVALSVPSLTTLYLFQDITGCGAGGSVNLSKMSVNVNGENYIYAIPIN